MNNNICEEQPKITRVMTIGKTIQTNTQEKIRESYLNWFFKKKQLYVILRQFKNKESDIKMYVALPVKERTFDSDTMDLFNISSIDNKDFPFSINSLIKYDTKYSGHMDKSTTIYSYLNTFKFTRRLVGNLARWSSLEQVTLFKDYTKTKVEQEHAFTLVPSFLDPSLSVVSIFRLLQTKYITIVELTFKPNSLSKNGTNTL